MAWFDPKVEAGAYESPVQRANPYGALASLVNTGVQASLTLMDKQNQVDQAQAEFQEDQASKELIQGYTGQIQKAETLRRQGREGEAARLESQAALWATNNGLNTGSAQLTSAYRAITGRDPEALGRTQEEILLQETRESPEYKQAWLINYDPNATSQENEANALNEVRAIAYHNQVVAKAKTMTEAQWVSEGQNAFQGVIRDHIRTNAGALALGASQGMQLQPEDVDSSYQNWRVLVGQITGSRPAGLSNDAWKPVADYIQSVEDMYTGLRERKDVISDTIAGNMLKAIEANPDLGLAQKYFLTNANPDVLRDYFSAQQISDLLNATNYDNVGMYRLGQGSPEGAPTVGGNQTPSLFNPKVLEATKESDPIDYLARAVEISKAIESHDFTQLAANRNSTERLANNVSHFAASLSQMAVDFDDYASGGEINKMLDGSMLAGIEALSKVEPEVGNVLYRQVAEALDNQWQAGQSKLTESTKGFLRWDEKRKSIVFDADNLRPRFRSDYADTILRDVDNALEMYNGDVSAFLKDEGARAGNSASIKHFFDTLGANFLRNRVGTINKHRDALGAIANHRDRFRAKAQEYSGSEGDTDLGGSQGSDTLQDQAFQPLYDMGVPKDELQTILNKESFGGDPTAQNPDSSAVGLFQFTDMALGELGYEKEEILSMSAEEQAQVYRRYLKRWKWKPGIPLGMMQAAPAMATKPDDTVVYKEGTEAWDLNPGWRPSDGGDITVGSIKAYYQ